VTRLRQEAANVVAEAVSGEAQYIGLEKIATALENGGRE
jgi:hypothetical protein